MKFAELKELIDTGAAAPTNSSALQIMGSISFYMRLTRKTGTIDDCVAVLQCSPDEIVWDNVADTEVTFGVGETFKMLNNIIISSLFVRLQITTESTIASTADLIIQGK